MKDESDLAQQSQRRLADLLENQRVQIRRQDKDRYGRTLAAVSVDGRDVRDQLVREGLARTWSGRRGLWCYFDGDPATRAMKSPQ